MNCFDVKRNIIFNHYIKNLRLVKLNVLAFNKKKPKKQKIDNIKFY